MQLPWKHIVFTHLIVLSTEEGVLLIKAERAFLTSLNIAIEVNHFLLSELLHMTNHVMVLITSVLIGLLVTILYSTDICYKA